ncbi:MAG: fumarylacetoacetate hydrolase family protein [Candidatus Nitrosotenuis sp.]|uniref:5-carboxymethyl-2-hydroxymuconate Delta-isomerase n=1 Tax=Candidatus Nitrosotenuis uzonensis TaxID=1407055 RepID=A0A812F4A5_9ARCH|nr:fumarylacetoacetate hydrolase family protein [Candidatus Nitrosotenuis uzonensis]CAE6493784.1 5-carboxymethyl-2-hydroxymuconate Delta-isomerase [Candidatus Nitrosotenuis uzonensis]
MKIGRFLISGKETYGFVKDGKIATKEEIISKTGIPIPLTIKEFLFDGWYSEVISQNPKLEYAVSISDVKILAPVPNPPKIICLAFNYVDHAKEQNLTPPQEPAIVMIPRTTLNGTNSEIVCPSFVKQLDYEVELALVIGKGGKNIPESESLSHIFGYMVFNDVSARDVQAQDKQFGRAKGFDTFAPCGPWITTADEIADPQNLKLRTWINGTLRQDSSTSNMFIKIPSIISKISKVMTLEKGDIISTGTPAGVMLNKPNAVFLQDGDKIEMEIEMLGKLENTVKFVP